MLVYIAGKALHTYNTHTHTHIPWIRKFSKMTVPTHTHTQPYILQSYSKLALRNKSSIILKISFCFSFHSESVLLLKIFFHVELRWQQHKTLSSLQCKV